MFLQSFCLHFVISYNFVDAKLNHYAIISQKRSTFASGIIQNTKTKTFLRYEDQETLDNFDDSNDDNRYCWSFCWRADFWVWLVSNIGSRCCMAHYCYNLCTDDDARTIILLCLIHSFLSTLSHLLRIGANGFFLFYTFAHKNKKKWDIQHYLGTSCWVSAFMAANQ